MTLNPFTQTSSNSSNRYHNTPPMHPMDLDRRSSGHDDDERIIYGEEIMASAPPPHIERPQFRSRSGSNSAGSQGIQGVTVNLGGIPPAIEMGQKVQRNSNSRGHDNNSNHRNHEISTPTGRSSNSAGLNRNNERGDIAVASARTSRTSSKRPSLTNGKAKVGKNIPHNTSDHGNGNLNVNGNTNTNGNQNENNNENKNENEEENARREKKKEY